MSRPLSQPDAVAVERAELDAWRDMYRAMPPGFSERFGADMVDVGGVLVTRCRAIPFVHFNAVLNLGLQEPATEAVLDRVVESARAASIRRLTVMHHPFSQPAALTEWLAARGFDARTGWDRVYRLAESPAASPEPRGEVAFVQPDTAAAWAAFLDKMYGLPTSPWLLALAGRPGWVHATLTRNGAIVAVRSMFVQASQSAWFGVEAPVPGLMAPSFDDDHCLLHALAAEAVRQGARTLAADVEAPTADRSGPAYDRWRSLGFSVGYHRSHYVKELG